MTAPPPTPPGYYPSPSNPAVMQWWDGQRWGAFAPVAPPALYAAPSAPQGPKSVSTAYLLFFLLGGFAAHRFYLGRVATGVTFLLGWWIGWALTVFASTITPQTEAAASLKAATGGIGFLLLAVVFIWGLVDLFRIPSMVRAANHRIMTTSQHQIRY